MSAYDTLNRCVFSFRGNTDNDGADMTSLGRLFQTLGPAEANDQSMTSHLLAPVYQLRTLNDDSLK